jgi:hypothetical protein
LICLGFHAPPKFGPWVTACPFQWRAASRKRSAIEESRICVSASVAVAVCWAARPGNSRRRRPAGSASSDAGRRESRKNRTSREGGARNYRQKRRGGIYHRRERR